MNADYGSWVHMAYFRDATAFVCNQQDMHICAVKLNRCGYETDSSMADVKGALALFIADKKGSITQPEASQKSSFQARIEQVQQIGHVVKSMGSG